MKKLHLFNVSASIPESLSFLETLSKNLWWSWNLDAVELFKRVEPDLWKNARSNPLILLNSVSQERFDALAVDEDFIDHLGRVKKLYEKDAVWSKKNNNPVTAYFSLEFGIHESLKLYSGGLGVLAGDHLKSSSDLQIPLVGICLLYRQGYFSQYLNKDGMQQESYSDTDVYNLPIEDVVDENDNQIIVSVDLPEGPLKAAVRKIDVGRIPLYLLDSNIPENPPEFRDITARLYGGDRLMRIRQEILLGIGGIKMLEQLGINYSACHMNEGHAAFLALARISELMKKYDISIEEAKEISRRSTVFTTHTPVPAGNETFKKDLIIPHLKALEKTLGIPTDTVVSWGEHYDNVSMTILGLNLAQYCNGVSKLHGKVSRDMWSFLWPDLPVDELPITHITNGIHHLSWLSIENITLFSKYLNSGWHTFPGNNKVLKSITKIPDDELWISHTNSKARLVRTVREYANKQNSNRNATTQEIDMANNVLSHDILTIGFARRFATYKRATLIFRDFERLKKILCNEKAPVQIIIAGKAHPADEDGKKLIQKIVEFSKDQDVLGKIVFLEDYDIRLGRRLVQGVDIWLNNPERPREASGTSGMKAAANGGLNLSILDGWWDEGFDGKNGWAIGHGEEYDNPEYRDEKESQALYNILENKVIPTYYNKTGGDYSKKWLSMMKEAILKAFECFTSNRMVEDYNSMFYENAKKNFAETTKNNCAAIRDFVKYRDKIEKSWGKIKLESPITNKDISEIHVGDSFLLKAKVYLDGLSHNDVEVQIYYGTVDSQNKIIKSCCGIMDIDNDLKNGNFLFKYNFKCKKAGRYGFTARIVPKAFELKNCIPPFIKWAE